MFQKKDRGDVLFECPIFVCLSLRLTWAEYRVVATRHQVCFNLSVTFVFLSLDLDIEQLKHVIQKREEEQGLGCESPEGLGFTACQCV